MAEEESKEAQQQPYQFTNDAGVAGNSSKDYTGRGTATYPNGEIYEGDFVDGRRTGKGKYTYSNGDKYEGEFKDNWKEGIGRLTYANKSEYYGTKRLMQASSNKARRTDKGSIPIPTRTCTPESGATARSTAKALTFSTRRP